MWSLNLIAAPTAEPLDLTSEALPHLRVTQAEASNQATVLSGAIAAAREACEAFTFRQLITAEWELWIEDWWDSPFCCHGAIRLPRPPLQQRVGTAGAWTAGVKHIKYLDTAGVEQTLAEDQYQIDAPAGPLAPRGRIFPAYGVSWPASRCQPGAVKIRFTAGYGATFASVPAALKNGIKLLVGEFYERREIVTTGTIQSANQISAERCWWPYRAW